MIVNLQQKRQTEAQKILETLKEWQWEFHLTGSRFFFPDKVNEKTDWDFFTQYDEVIVQKLKKMGFDPLTTTGYSDLSIIFVMRFVDTNTGEQIDIQLIHPSYMEFKIKAQCILQKFEMLEGKNKNQARQIWGSMIQILSS